VRQRHQRLAEYQPGVSMMRRRDFLAIAAASAAAGVATPAFGAPSDPAVMYICGLPNKLMTLIESDQKVIDTVALPTGVGRGLFLSNDRSKIFLNTWPHCGIEVFDRNTRKIVSSFRLDNGNRRYWLRSLAPDPEGKLLYTVVNARTKLVDRFEIELPKLAIIDVAQEKIVKTAEFPEDERNSFSGMGALKLSPDGRYLYQFRDKILVFDTSDFKLVQKIELSKPAEFNEMETVSMTMSDDPHDKPGMVTAMFNAADSIVHQPIFGLAEINLVDRTYEFTPLGPDIDFMTPLKLAPDRKTGYLVAFRDTLGNRHTEFWVFDMTTKKRIRTVEFPGPTQIRFGLSSTGKDIFIYGNYPIMNIYDAATLQHKRDVDLNADLSSYLLLVPPA
jgi:hypothetical protein